MNRRIFWYLCVFIATGIVALFYFIDQVTTQTEEGMSHIAEEHRIQLKAWGKEAENLYLLGDKVALENWLSNLQKQENTWATVAKFDVEQVAGNDLTEQYHVGYNMGRSVDWKIHLYFKTNPVMELPFSKAQTSLLIRLPQRMRPGVYWSYTDVALQIIIPIILLGLLAYFLYRHIMKPLHQIQSATKQFSAGNLNVRATKLMGNRHDEFSELASAFDHMADRIGEQLVSQRQLIADLSHELRTPLTRLDIALAEVERHCQGDNIERISRESKHIRKLVEDSLTLAWLENERPELQQESLELTDLLDVIVEDASFEFPNVCIESNLPSSALIDNSSHRAAGQAIENVLRNALRYTPQGKCVEVSLTESDMQYHVKIKDQGPGVPEPLLQAIFEPFFRVDKSRERKGNSFGLGLALAKRQLSAIRGRISANNRDEGGLEMHIVLPKC